MIKFDERNRVISRFVALPKVLEVDTVNLNRPTEEQLLEYYRGSAEYFRNGEKRHLYEIRYIGEVSVEDVPPEPVKPKKVFKFKRAGEL